jgi:hypothetical protein
MRYLTVIFLLLGLISCEENNLPNNDNHNDKLTSIETDTIFIEDGRMSPTIQQGFYGFIIELKGDFMPGEEPSVGTIDSVQMDLYVYYKLTFDSIKNARSEQNHWFWIVDSVNQVPLAIIKPNDNGFYEIDLPNGNYTGLVKIDDKNFYTNGGLEDGHIGAMILDNEELIKQDFQVDYQASY